MKPFEVTREIKAELRIPAEPTVGPLKELQRLKEIRSLIWEEVHRFDNTVYAHQQTALEDVFKPTLRFR